MKTMIITPQQYFIVSNAIKWELVTDSAINLLRNKINEIYLVCPDWRYKTDLHILRQIKERAFVYCGVHESINFKQSFLIKFGYPYYSAKSFTLCTKLRGKKCTNKDQKKTDICLMKELRGV